MQKSNLLSNIGCLMAVLFSVGACAQTPAIGQTTTVDPLVGTWVHLVGGRDDGLCEEVIRINAAGTTTASSGHSRNEGLWAIEGGGNDGAIFRPLKVEINKHNSVKDCIGKLPPVAQALHFVTRVHPTGQWAEICTPQTGSRQCRVWWRVSN